MRILVICQNYYPEQFRITDICEELVARGHQVTVLTGEPNYPMGKIFPGYNWGHRKYEDLHGVQVHRCFTVGRRRNALFRVLNYYSFAISSSCHVTTLPDNFDVVLVNQLSPIMMAQAGIRYAKRHKKPLVLYTLDLWPESLTAGGIRRGSAVYAYYHSVSRNIYRAADAILVTSRNFQDYLKEEFDIPDKLITYLPQYAEDLFSPSDCAKQPSDTVDLMFAGNIGAAQSVTTIIRAADACRDVSQLRWHIVGDGSELDHCKALAAELKTDNVIFHARQPLEAMPALYAMADAMLVTMGRNPFISRTLPGKVQTYLAAGKPILAAADGETARVIAALQCGQCGPADDWQHLADLARAFCTLGMEERLHLAQAARRGYEQAFSKDSFFQGLNKSLTACVHEHSAN